MLIRFWFLAGAYEPGDIPPFLVPLRKLHQFRGALTNHGSQTLMSDLILLAEGWIEKYPALVFGGVVVPESQHVAGEGFVYRTKRYLEATLTIDVTWTVYDNTGMTLLNDLAGTSHTYDLLGMLKEGPKTPIFVEAKFRHEAGDINTEFDNFLKISFSCYLANKAIKNPYFMFATSRPFKSSSFHKLTTLDYLRNTVGRCADYGLKSPADQDLLEFSSRVWWVIWSNRQDLMAVSDPKLYAKLSPRGGSSHDQAV